MMNYIIKFIEDVKMIYSPVCNNPSKGFKNVDGYQVPIAGQGYMVLTLEECEEAFNNPEWYEKLRRLQK